ncbi:GTP-binding protein Di-Ras2 [Nematostella vectensis]|uniref:GTP-binding protein Di-Ras2 n=1 Tax=Nematostella vectensis TaxID=45351 RepID=UPI00138FBDA5|nr:GTP-binding protein Di-Ras2 [Nematostella vectensis]
MKKQQKSSKRKASHQALGKRSSAYLKKLTIAVLGEGRVGKSSLIRGFCGEGFQEEYVPTIEEFVSKHLLYNDRTYQLDIIDTCGSENFPAIRRVDIAKADAIILVYSIDNPRSFEQLQQYREEIIAEKGNSVPVLVVANKSDLSLDGDGHSLTITDRLGCRVNTRDVVLKRWKYLWSITSCKMNWGVQEPFHGILDEIQRKKLENNNNNNSPTMQRKTSWLNRNLSLSLRRTRSART